MAKKKSFQISDALTNGLEETITAAHNYSGELQIDIIPLKRIELDPDNPRDLLINLNDLFIGLSESDKQYQKKLAEIKSLQTLANSIKEQGIINPIVVYKYGEKYRLIAGERRTLSSILAGKNEIQAKILDHKPDALKISLLQWIENIERSDLSLWERLRNLEKIIAAQARMNNISNEKITVTELSNLIGCSKPHAMNYKAVLEANSTLKELIAENKIKNLEKAALIANTKAKDLQDEMIQACLSGATLKKLKLMIEQNKSNKQSEILKKSSTRGRQASSVSLGVTKNISVAKVILNTLMNSNELKHVSQYFTNVELNNYKSITNTFKQFLKKLEELHT